MPNPFGKSRDTAKPYAIYTGPMGFEWRILKTYKLAKNEDSFARWFVAAKSDDTFGIGFDEHWSVERNSHELGDTYAIDVKRYGRLVAADPAWLEAYDIRPGVPTPAEYLATVDA